MAFFNTAGATVILLFGLYLVLSFWHRWAAVIGEQMDADDAGNYRAAGTFVITFVWVMFALSVLFWWM